MKIANQKFENPEFFQRLYVYAAAYMREFSLGQLKSSLITSTGAVETKRDSASRDLDETVQFLHPDPEAVTSKTFCYVKETSTVNSPISDAFAY